jgi:hypothetical protein
MVLLINAHKVIVKTYKSEGTLLSV